MSIQGILFDLYGTLIDIETDESMDEIYRGIAHFLTYHGLYIHRGEVRDSYYRIMKDQRDKSREEHPEIDVLSIWDTFLSQQGVKSSPARRRLAKTLAQIYRGISRKRLALYPEAKGVLENLKKSCRLALVSDAQQCYAIPEIRALSLEGYFDSIIISSEYGFRKPDPRLIIKALSSMSLHKGQVLFVGNDMYRDIYGAKLLGIRTVLFQSNQGAKSHVDTSADHTIEDLRQLEYIVIGYS
ncbi:MAG: HAD family hydrolase [Desulfobacteraceae bacterium]|jgi:putative hydrolase of the HAD superfamily|nr:MAG: HAD family hydrolase [Desulfobacteraceae bacterium]